jgi:hypothetical protein
MRHFAEHHGEVGRFRWQSILASFRKIGPKGHDEPSLVDRVEEAPDIRIEYIVHLPIGDSENQCIQRIMLASSLTFSARG